MRKTLSEYLTAVVWKRRSTLIAAPSVVLGIIAWAANKALTLQGGTVPQQQWTPSAWWWVYSFLLGVCLVQLLAWRDEHLKLQRREVEAAQSESTYAQRVSELTRKIEDNGPTITLGYDKAALLQEEFYIQADKDILNASVTSPAPVRADLPSVIKAGVKVPVEFLSISGDETESGFERAFDEFCGDRQEVSIPLNFIYSDHRENEYQVRWLVAWKSLDFRLYRSVEVKPEKGSYRWIAPKGAINPSPISSQQPSPQSGSASWD